jgi:hypothetical protein
VRMRNITLVGLFTVLLAASFSARSPAREAAREAEVGAMSSQLGDDTPITISDGSPLTLHSVLPWVEYGRNEIGPKEVNRTVTEVNIMVNKVGLKPVVSKNEGYDFDITYGTIRLTVKTNRSGRGLRVSTSQETFDKPWIRKDQHTYSIEIPRARITHVTFRQPEERDFPLRAGPKTITIHYWGPVVK